MPIEERRREEKQRKSEEVRRRREKRKRRRRHKSSLDGGLAALLEALDEQVALAQLRLQRRAALVELELTRALAAQALLEFADVRLELSVPTLQVLELRASTNTGTVDSTQQHSYVLYSTVDVG